jgi:hypothetical protein
MPAWSSPGEAQRVDIVGSGLIDVGRGEDIVLAELFIAFGGCQLRRTHSVRFL